MQTTARYGLTTPGLTLNVDRHSSWEKSATIADIAAVCQAADRLGFDHLTCSEHVGIPVDVEKIRGGRYYDPLAIFGYLAAVTPRIRLATYVLVLGYSHPLEIAKRYGTLDVVSGGGRVILGLGVGSLKPEFDLLGLGGAEFAERGKRGDEALRALRAAWGRRLPVFHGAYYDFDDFIIDPCALSEDVPFWIGGRSMRSLKRAVTLGDGWAPFGLSVEQMGKMIAEARQLPEWTARAEPIDLVLRHDGLIDPQAKPDEAADAIRATFAVGATKVNLGFVHQSRAHYIEQLEALAALAID
jgi:probable F420-dependent oxidoreductase